MRPWTGNGAEYCGALGAKNELAFSYGRLPGSSEFARGIDLLATLFTLSVFPEKSACCLCFWMPKIKACLVRLGKEETSWQVSSCSLRCRAHRSGRHGRTAPKRRSRQRRVASSWTRNRRWGGSYYCGSWPKSPSGWRLRLGSRWLSRTRRDLATPRGRRGRTQSGCKSVEIVALA